MCFLSDKADVNEYKPGILHKATVYMEQNPHSRLIHDSDSEVKIRNFFLEGFAVMWGTIWNIF